MSFCLSFFFTLIFDLVIGQDSVLGGNKTIKKMYVTLTLTLGQSEKDDVGLSIFRSIGLYMYPCVHVCTPIPAFKHVCIIIYVTA